jgi:hypothetical protein
MQQPSKQHCEYSNTLLHCTELLSAHGILNDSNSMRNWQLCACKRMRRPNNICTTSKVCHRFPWLTNYRTRLNSANIPAAVCTQNQ